MHSESEIKKLFPTIHAAPECPNSFDWKPNSKEEMSNRGRGIASDEEVAAPLRQIGEGAPQETRITSDRLVARENECVCVCMHV